MATLKEMVAGRVKFKYFSEGSLWYVTSVGDFEFPVPISDAGTGRFQAEDKAILFMRWIRAQLKIVESWTQEELTHRQKADALIAAGWVWVESRDQWVPKMGWPASTTEEAYARLTRL